MSALTQKVQLTIAKGSDWRAPIEHFNRIRGHKTNARLEATNELFKHGDLIFDALASGAMDRLDEYAAKHKLSGGDAVDRLLNGSSGKRAKSAKTQTAENAPIARLTALATQAGLTLDAYVEHVLSAADKAKQPSPEVLATLDDEKSLRIPGTAAYRIYQAAEEIMSEARLCITTSMLQRATGSNRRAVAAWVKTHAKRIDEYHESLGVDPTDRAAINEHNRRTNAELAKLKRASETKAT